MRGINRLSVAFLVLVLLAALAVLGWLLAVEAGRRAPTEGMAVNDPSRPAYTGEDLPLSDWPTATPWVLPAWELATATLTPEPTATFTPAPPTATLPPTRTPRPTRIPTATLPVATIVIPEEMLNDPTPPPHATPAPTPDLARRELEVDGWVQLPVELDRQTLLAVDHPECELPGEIKDFEGEWPVPPPLEFVSRNTPCVFWGAMFRFGPEDADYVFKGRVRWWQLPPPPELVGGAIVPPRLRHEDRDIVLSAASPLFLVGHGSDLQRIWRAGEYRVELVNEEFRPVIEWFFTVR